MRLRRNLIVGLIVLTSFMLMDNAKALVEVGRVTLPYPNPTRVFMHVAGDYAYLGSYADRKVYIYNVADKTSPQIMSTIATNYHNIHDIWSADGYVYTAHRFGGINMIDVSNPSAPTIVSSRNDGYIHKGLTTVGNYLYSGKNLQIYDIKGGFLDPKGSLPVTFDGFEVVVTPDGQYAYHYVNNTGGAPTGIYDVTDKSNPFEIGTFYGSPEPGPLWEMEISPDGSYLYGGWTRNATGHGSGFVIFDLTDPTSPQPVSQVSHPLLMELSLDHVNQILFVRNGWDDATISAYDVSDPSLPEKIDCHDTPFTWYSNWQDIAASEGYLYVIDDRDLVVMSYEVMSNEVTVFDCPLPIPDCGAVSEAIESCRLDMTSYDVCCVNDVTDAFVSSGTITQDQKVIIEAAPSCAVNPKNHGKFVSCTAGLTNHLISNSAHERFMNCIGETDVGKKPKRLLRKGRSRV